MKLFTYFILQKKIEYVVTLLRFDITDSKNKLRLINDFGANLALQIWGEIS